MHAMDAGGTPQVTLTVVIGTREDPAILAPVLEALVPEVRSVGGEVVIAHSGARHSPDGPYVRWLACGDELNLIRLRQRAFRAGRGAVLAVGEDHAVPAAGWARSVLRAHTEHPEADVVAGSFINVTDRTPAGRANFLAFAAPTLAPRTLLRRPPPSPTLSFKRRVLEGLGDQTGSLESSRLPRLWTAGRVVVDERVVVYHHQDHGIVWSTRNAFANTRTHYGYAYAGREWRARSPVLRWVASVLPQRTWHEAHEAEPELRRRPVDMAMVGLLIAATSAGAAVGIVAGPGRSAERVA